MCGHRSVAAPTKRVVKFINFAQNRLVKERFENLVAPKNRFFLRLDERQPGRVVGRVH